MLDKMTETCVLNELTNYNRLTEEQQEYSSNDFAKLIFTKTRSSYFRETTDKLIKGGT